MKIIFKTAKATMEGTFNNSRTAKKIYEKLPLESTVNTWGEEIYFNISVLCDPEDPTSDVRVGDIAYWPPAQCLCLFFGRTPASTNDQPMPASEVNLIGKITTDPSVFKKIKTGDRITVEVQK